MSTPIRREDIRKGDRIRKEYAAETLSGSTALEFTAKSNGIDIVRDLEGNLFLIERPVTLPTEVGCTIAINGEHDGKPAHGPGSRFVRAEGGEAWFNYRGPIAPGVVRALVAEHGFTIVGRPVAKVAAEVLAEVRRLSVRNKGFDVCIMEFDLRMVMVNIEAAK